MCSSSFQGSFKALEVDPTQINTSLTTLQPAMQAVTDTHRALLDGSAWKGRHTFWGDGKRRLDDLEEGRLPLLGRVATGAEVPCTFDLRTSVHHYL